MTRQDADSTQPLERHHANDRLSARKFNQPVDALNRTLVGTPVPQQVVGMRLRGSGGVLTLFKYKSMAPDYIVVTKVTGTGEQFVAKPFLLRRTPFESTEEPPDLTRLGRSYRYLTNTLREVTREGGEVATQHIYGEYVVGDPIYAVQNPIGGTGVIVGEGEAEKELRWLEVNVDARHWLDEVVSLIDHYALIICGSNNGTRYDDVDLFCGDGWKTAAPVPVADEPRILAEAFGIKGRVYLVGGWINGGSVCSQLVPFYDGIDDTWTSGDVDYPIRRMEQAACVINGKGYTFYGRTTSGTELPHDDTYEFETKRIACAGTGTWLRGRDGVPPVRANCAGDALNGHAHVLGGYVNLAAGEPGVLDNHDTYSPVLNTWNQDPAPPHNPRVPEPIHAERNSFEALTILEKLYYFCGQSSASIASIKNDVYKYEAETNTWAHVIDGSNGNLPDLRGTYGAFAFNDKGYITGGYDGSGRTRRVAEFDPIVETWTQDDLMPAPARWEHVGVSV